jgi:hypothetical protein
VGNPFLDRQAAHQIGKSGRKSERRLALSLGARPTPASGALSRSKGDAKLGKLLLEMKSTVSNSMLLELSWLNKITSEAQACGMQPALIVSFVTPEGRPRSESNAEWACVPRWLLEELLGD